MGYYGISSHLNRFIALSLNDKGKKLAGLTIQLPNQVKLEYLYRLLKGRKSINCWERVFYRFWPRRNCAGKWRREIKVLFQFGIERGFYSFHFVIRFWLVTHRVQRLQERFDNDLSDWLRCDDAPIPRCLSNAEQCLQIILAALFAAKKKPCRWQDDIVSLNHLGSGAAFFCSSHTAHQAPGDHHRQPRRISWRDSRFHPRCCERLIKFQKEITSRWRSFLCGRFPRSQAAHHGAHIITADANRVVTNRLDGWLPPINIVEVVTALVSTFLPLNWVAADWNSGHYKLRGEPLAAFFVLACGCIAQSRRCQESPSFFSKRVVIVWMSWPYIISVIFIVCCLLYSGSSDFQQVLCDCLKIFTRSTQFASHVDFPFLTIP
jgi:hypothetical protein